MNSVTNEDVQTVLETLKQDLKSPEAQQELGRKTRKGVFQRQSPSMQRVCRSRTIRLERS